MNISQVECELGVMVGRDWRHVLSIEDNSGVRSLHEPQLKIKFMVSGTLYHSRVIVLTL